MFRGTQNPSFPRTSENFRFPAVTARPQFTHRFRRACQTQFPWRARIATCRQWGRAKLPQRPRQHLSSAHRRGRAWHTLHRRRRQPCPLGLAIHAARQWAGRRWHRGTVVRDHRPPWRHHSARRPYIKRRPAAPTLCPCPPSARHRLECPRTLQRHHRRYQCRDTSHCHRRARSSRLQHRRRRHPRRPPGCQQGLPREPARSRRPRSGSLIPSSARDRTRRRSTATGAETPICLRNALLQQVSSRCRNRGGRAC